MLLLKLKFLFKQAVLLNSEESWKRCWLSAKFEQNLCQQINPGKQILSPPLFCSSHGFNRRIGMVLTTPCYPKERDSELFFPLKGNNINTTRGGIFSLFFS